MFSISKISCQKGGQMETIPNKGMKQKHNWLRVINRNCNILLLNYDKVIAKEVFDVRKFYFMKRNCLHLI